MKRSTLMMLVVFLFVPVSKLSFADTYELTIESKMVPREKKAETIEHHFTQQFRLARDRKNRTITLKFFDQKIKRATKNQKNTKKKLNNFTKTVVKVKRTSSFEVEHVTFTYDGTTYRTKNLLDFESGEVPDHVERMASFLRRAIVFFGRKVEVGGIFEIKHRKSTSTANKLPLKDVTPYKFYGVRTHDSKLKYLGHVQKTMGIDKKNKAFKTVSKELGCFNKKIHFFECQETRTYRSTPLFSSVTRLYKLKPLRNGKK